MTDTLPPAGWYTDPTNSTLQRYWDGHAWTTVTRIASPHERSSESSQTRKESQAPKQSLVKTVADWFNTGTAAVKFLKALAGLLAFLGIITVGGAIAGGSSGGSGGGSGVTGSSSTPVASLSSALLQPSDLGATGVLGWTQTQIPSSSGTAPSCPLYPKLVGNVDTALSDASTGILVIEYVWKIANPAQAISTFVNSAQNCSFTDSSGNYKDTYQADYADGSYGDRSAIFTVGLTSTAFPNETPTIGAYQALISRGNLIAAVRLTTGTDGVVSQSTLNQIFTAAAGRLS